MTEKPEVCEKCENPHCEDCVVSEILKFKKPSEFDPFLKLIMLETKMNKCKGV